MKFSLMDTRYKDLDPSIQKEISDKLFQAEKNLATVRFLIVLSNTFFYFFFYDKTLAIQSLALSIVVAANAYVLFVAFFHPYKNYPVLITSYFTSGTDAILITLWLIATGCFESPFYPLWYVSIIAISMRYSMLTTYVTAVIYALLYTSLFSLDTMYFGRHPDVSDLVIRLIYLGFIAMLGSIMNKEIMDQIEAKIIIKKSEEELIRKREELKEVHSLLEDRVMKRTNELAESNKQLLRINEDIDNFVYSASHDLKSPILNIEALLQILHENQSNPTEFEKSVKEKLDLSVRKMKQTINNLAEVGKAQKEIYDDVAIINFEEVLSDLISENEEVLKRENVQLEYNFNMAGSILCSRTCLKSIMYNFLTNSIKYKDPSRPPVIKFYTKPEKEFVALFIQDNGLGIDLQKNGKKLFSLFKRFHDHVEGAGIGLYTVKKMVEKYQGDILVDSQPGQGTTFIVRFKSNHQKADLSRAN